MKIIKMGSNFVWPLSLDLVAVQKTRAEAFAKILSNRTAAAAGKGQNGQKQRAASVVVGNAPSLGTAMLGRSRKIAILCACCSQVASELPAFAKFRRGGRVGRKFAHCTVCYCKIAAAAKKRLCVSAKQHHCLHFVPYPAWVSENFTRVIHFANFIGGKL